MRKGGEFYVLDSRDRAVDAPLWEEFLREDSQGTWDVERQNERTR
jgi:hypothetical protein